MDEATWDEVVVVADRFANFAENGSVMTLGAVSASLAAGTLVNGKPIRLRPGLGVQDDDWAEVRARLAASQRPDRRAAAAGLPARPLPADEVLKLDHTNVLLADLRETGPRAYRADLVLPPDTEMILDHTAERQHIPGMLLIEACCQLLIAATGRFLDRERPGRSYYAVMQHLEVEFRRFVFPLPAHLDLTIESWEDTNAERPTFVSAIDQRQLGATGATAMDVGAACAGFMYALHTAVALRRSGAFGGPTLVIAAERYSRHLDHGDRRTASLFGDGAGAVVLDHVPDPYGFIHSDIGSDGSGEEFARIELDSHRSEDLYTLKMDGRAVRSFMEQQLPVMLDRALAATPG